MKTSLAIPSLGALAPSGRDGERGLGRAPRPRAGWASFVPAVIRAALVFAIAAFAPLAAAVVGTHTAKPLGANGGAPYGYFEYLPANYQSSSTPCKLLLFLHGIGECADYPPGNQPLSVVLYNGPPAMIEGNAGYTYNSTLFNDNNCIVISPQSPHQYWDAAAIESFMNWLLARYRVDTNRIYVTGLSLGGGGTWQYLRAYGSSKVAACVPCCGANPPGPSDLGFNVPTWAFHSADDSRVYWGDTRQWVDACATAVAGHAVSSALANFPGGDAARPPGDQTGHFTAAGGWAWTAGSSVPSAGQNPNWTQYQNGDHAGGWIKSYNNLGMWNWLFAQSRGGATTAPELDISRGGVAVADGGTDSVAGTTAGVATGLSYSLINSGTAALSITTPVSISGVSNCSVSVGQPGNSVAAAGGTVMTLSVTPNAPGAWSFVIAVTNTDANESPYNWTVGGSAGGAAAAPELDISRAGIAIADGGSESVTGTTAGSATTLSYALVNSGAGGLSITTPVSISGASNCSVSVGQPGTSVAAGGTTVMVITVTPNAPGAWNFTIAVTNTDANESPYNWTVGGNAGGVAAAPELDISRAGIAIADGGSESVTGAIAGSATTLSYALVNSGAGGLSITTPVSISGASNCSVSVGQPGTSVAAGGTTVMVLTVTPSAPGAWSFTVAVTNTDANESPYNWTVGGSARGTSIASHIVVDAAGTATTTMNALGMASTIANAVDTTGAASGVRIAVTQPFGNSNDFGVDSTALYPSTAQKTALWVDRYAAVPHADVVISQLPPGATFDLILFASRAANDDRTTVYTVNGQAKSLNATNNTTATAQFLGLTPAPDGTIRVVVTAGGASQYGYLNVLELVVHPPGGAG